MRQFRVLVNGNEYNVAIEELEETGATTVAMNNPRQMVKPAVVQSSPTSEAKVKAVIKPKRQAPDQPKPEAKPKSDSSSDSPGVIKAAMPGTILSVNVTVGEEVTRGQALLILEAMKMENEIMAPSDGVISEIHATVGASVNSGDLLIVLS